MALCWAGSFTLAVSEMPVVMQQAWQRALQVSGPQSWRLDPWQS